MSGGGCPVDHEAMAKAQQLHPHPHPHHGAGALPNGAGCPVDHQAMQQAREDHLSCSAGVEDERIDPRNQMPPPNQTPAPGQQKALSKHRMASTIPRDGNDESPTWVYPSPQMFYNAMRRKGWTPSEDDMNSIVAIHNSVNEYAWSKVLEWEALHCDECASPKLVSFRGRAKDFSPKARLRQVVGYVLPFDRHDWVIDRCGTKVRYVIDYYAGSGDSKGGAIHTAPVKMFLDVRPAVDSVGSVWDRMRMAWHRSFDTVPQHPNLRHNQQLEERE